jgi:hypothetical protein
MLVLGSVVVNCVSQILTDLEFLIRQAKDSFTVSLIHMARTVTIRQTTDPYAVDIQYIASREVTLEPNGSLPFCSFGLENPAVSHDPRTYLSVK